MRRNDERTLPADPRGKAGAHPAPASGRPSFGRSMRLPLTVIVALAPLFPVAAPSARAEVESQVIGIAREAVRFLVEREVGVQHRVEVRVGQLDTSRPLSPCARIEPFVPQPLRPWGTSAIGVRCVDGERWSVLLTVTVNVFGKALVATAALPSGSSPSAGDFRIEEVDLTRELAPVVGDAAVLHGRLLTRSLAAGQTLHLDALRAAPTADTGNSSKGFPFGRTLPNIAKTSHRTLHRPIAWEGAPSPSRSAPTLQ